MPKSVLINYPIVDSLGKDNIGGFSHLMGNISCYNLLGYKVYVVSRLNISKLIVINNGAVFFNIIPGRAVPFTSLQKVEFRRARAINFSYFWLHTVLYKNLVNLLLDIFLYILLKVLSIDIVHERWNRRYSLSRIRCFISGVRFIFEKNDHYVGAAKKDDLILTTAHDPIVAKNSLKLSWPVVSTGKFSSNSWKSKVLSLPSKRCVNVCLFGGGGLSDLEEIGFFVDGHPWLNDASSISVTVSGLDAGWEAVSLGRTVVTACGHLHHSSLTRFDLGLVFYSASVYPEARIVLGAPTKVYHYVDGSLPFISNRPYYSKLFNLGIDLKFVNEISQNELKLTAMNLFQMRQSASVQNYAQKLNKKISELY